MNNKLTCPSYGKDRIKRKAKVYPNCGYLIYEYFNHLEDSQPTNSSNVQPLYLAPTYCLIKKYKNADKKKTKLRFIKYSFVSIDYGMLCKIK